jgi:hypothetical protein
MSFGPALASRSNYLIEVKDPRGPLTVWQRCLRILETRNGCAASDLGSTGDLRLLGAAEKELDSGVIRYYPYGKGGLMRWWCWVGQRGTAMPIPAISI